MISTVLTNNGNVLLNRALAGTKLEFCELAVGSGTTTGDAKELTDLVNYRMATVLNEPVWTNQYVRISGVVVNSDVTEGFPVTELGLYAKDPDDTSKKILYARVAYTASEGGSITAASNAYIRRVFGIDTYVGDAQDVAVIVDSSAIFLTADALEEHNGSSTAHQDIRTSIETVADAALDEPEAGVYRLKVHADSHAYGGADPITPSSIKAEPQIKDGTTKDTPDDADSVALVDSADGSKTKRVLWSKMKVALKAYLDDLFEPLLSGAVLLEDYPPNTGLFPFVDAGGTTKIVEWQVMVNALQELFAALSHAHAAGDITSGTLGLARGGTGAATAAAARTNLGAGAASGLATLDGSAKVAAAQASARIISKTASATLALAEAGCFIYFNNGTTACTLTVPANSSVAFPVGTEIEVLRGGTGTITIAAASGVTIYSVDSAKKIDSQFGVVCLKKTGTDTWVLAGCLGT